MHFSITCAFGGLFPIMGRLEPCKPFFMSTRDGH
jgi:hypothetical protein